MPAGRPESAISLEAVRPASPVESRVPDSVLEMQSRPSLHSGCFSVGRQGVESIDERSGSSACVATAARGAVEGKGGAANPSNPAARPGRSAAGAGPRLHEGHGDPLDLALPADAHRDDVESLAGSPEREAQVGPMRSFSKSRMDGRAASLHASRRPPRRR